MRIGRSCCKEKKDTYKPEALIRDRVEEVTLLLFCFNMICTCQARIMLRDRSLFITGKGKGEGGMGGVVGKTFRGVTIKFTRTSHKALWEDR